MQEWSEEQLKMVERCGAACMELKQLAKVLMVDYIELKKEYAKANSPLAAHYDKGFLITQLELRESAMKAALRGSNPALNMMLEIAKQTSLNNM
jgi:hypothetical protein